MDATRSRRSSTRRLVGSILGWASREAPGSAAPSRAATYAKQMPIAPLAKMAREDDTRIRRVVEHHVTKARAGMDFCDVSDIAMDETSARRGGSRA